VFAQIELEARYRNWPAIRFHGGCYRIWEAERQGQRRAASRYTAGQTGRNTMMRKPIAYVQAAWHSDER
jgi:hypothetical protein